MATRVTIRSTAAAGFGGRYRGGRFWPVAGVDADLLDAEEDAPDISDGGKTIFQIGRKTLAALRADGNFSFDNTAAVSDSIARVAELEAENAALKARVAELEAAASNKGKGAGK